MPWTVRDFMNDDLSAVEAGEPLEEALGSMKQSGLNVMPVQDQDGRFAGTLVRSDAPAGSDGVGELTVGDVSRKGLCLHPLDSREQAIATLEHLGLRRLPVVDDEQLVGALSFADLAQYEAIEQELGEAASAALPTEISERDNMLVGKRANYWNIGLSGLRSVRWAMSGAGITVPETILDLPCGHGRVLRFLQAAFPRTAITASDIDPDAIEFCRQTFGVTTFESRYDPAMNETEGAYDVIWCGSLLTHIDVARWKSLLEFFRSHVSRSGVVVFTTHGEWAGERLLEKGIIERAQLEESRRRGFAYADYPGRTGYGVSLSRVEWVRDFVDRETDLEILDQKERLWLGVQDVFACVARG